MLSSLKALVFSGIHQYGPRVCGAVVGYVATVASGKLGLSLDPAAQTALAMTIYGVVHKALDKALGGDPADAKPAA